MNKLIQKSKKMKNKKGFTLIELIVVIVIIGILAAIIVPRLSGFSDTAKEKADLATAKTIATAAMVVYTDKGLEEDVDGTNIANYLPDSLPDPQSETGEWSIDWDDGQPSVLAGTVVIYPVPSN